MYLESIMMDGLHIIFDYKVYRGIFDDRRNWQYYKVINHLSIDFLFYKKINFNKYITLGGSYNLKQIRISHVRKPMANWKFCFLDEFGLISLDV